MKRILKSKLALFVLILALAAGALAGCGGSGNDGAQAEDAPADEAATETPAETDATASDEAEAGAVTIKVGATPTPHAEILNQVVEDLAASGITLEIEEFTDYVLPNTALAAGDLTANYFQHKPYLDQFNEENGTKLVGVAPIHYEPFGLYPGKTKTIEDLKDGAQIAVPNDATNEARALLLLQDIGLITLKEDAGLEATKNDIDKNDKNLDIVEVEAAQLPKTLADVDLAIINGNYAIEAGLNASTDALATEAKDSLAATTYANLIVVSEGSESLPEVLALVTALQSDKVKKFIEDTYQGAVVPSF